MIICVSKLICMHFKFKLIRPMLLTRFAVLSTLLYSLFFKFHLNKIKVLTYLILLSFLGFYLKKASKDF